MNAPRRAAARLTILALLLAGCARSLPPQTDAAQAREALTAALDAWKDGRPPESLRDRNPPVDFSDTHREKGARLTAYQIKSEERSGVSVRFTVALSLLQEGKSRDRVIVYTADAGKAVVIRPEF